MAKKKVVTSTGRKSASRLARKRSASAGDRQSSNRKNAVARKSIAKTQPGISASPGGQTGLSNDQIGQVAGEVWQTLAENGGQNLATLKKSMDVPADLVLAAVGWLAREDKLEFATSGRSVTLSLR